MNLTKEKKQAFWILALAIFLHALAQRYTIRNESGYYEGSGLVIGLFGLVIWIYGMVKYARLKGRSELLAVLLSLFWLPGLLVLMILKDAKRSKSLKPAK